MRIKILPGLQELINKHKKASFAIITLGFAFLTVVVLAIAINIFMPLKTEETIIRIKPGETTKTIAYKLKKNNVIRSAFWFDILTRLTKSDRHLKSGRYVFGGNVSVLQSIIRIRAGHSSLLHVTIPEGFSLYQVLRKLEKSGLGSYESLYAVASDPQLIKRITGFEISSLEGFLYPETYSFDIDFAPEDIFALMTEQFFKRLSNAEIGFIDKQQFYKDLILASIVEQEAVKEDEKPLIAGVYLNRLMKKMKLESCPTVDYTLERQGIHRKRLTYEDLQIDSEYNTYKIDGLPPTPICNPSISSLQAVYHPQETDYLYFFADFEGRNVFSKTYSEHLNKQKLINKD